jgi:small subunit ribosomal protein S18
MLQKIAHSVIQCRLAHAKAALSNASAFSMQNYSYAQYYYNSKSSLCATSNTSISQFIRHKHDHNPGNDSDSVSASDSDSISETDFRDIGDISDPESFFNQFEKDFQLDDHPSTTGTEDTASMNDGTIDSLRPRRPRKHLQEAPKLTVSNRFPPKLTAEHYARLVRLVDLVSDPEITSALANEARVIESTAHLLMELPEAKSFVRSAAQMLARGDEPDDLIAFNTQLEYYLKIILAVYERKQAKTNVPQYLDDKGDIDFLSLTRTLRQKLKQPCRFCNARDPHDPNLSIHHLNIELMQSFLNLRGMIYPRKLTGNCMRHQHRLAEAIKRARQIGLLNPSSNWKAPPDWSTSTPLSGEHLPLPPFNSRGYIDPDTIGSQSNVDIEDDVDDEPDLSENDTATTDLKRQKN